MNRLYGIIFALAVAAVPAPLAAQGIDGSTPVLCAVIDAIECTPGGECLSGRTEDINAPLFIKIDFAAGSISGTRPDGSQLSTPIKRTVRLDGALILQGDEGGRGWTVDIGKESGVMTVTLAEDGAAIVIFGACTTP
jgi:hypothetical protein